MKHVDIELVEANIARCKENRRLCDIGSSEYRRLTRMISVYIDLVIAYERYTAVNQHEVREVGKLPTGEAL